MEGGVAGPQEGSTPQTRSECIAGPAWETAAPSSLLGQPSVAQTVTASTATWRPFPELGCVRTPARAASRQARHFPPEKPERTRKLSCHPTREAGCTVGSPGREQSCGHFFSVWSRSPLGPQKPYPLEVSKAEVRKDRVSWSKLVSICGCGAPALLSGPLPLHRVPQGQTVRRAQSGSCLLQGREDPVNAGRDGARGRWVCRMHLSVRSEAPRAWSPFGFCTPSQFLGSSQFPCPLCPFIPSWSLCFLSWVTVTCRCSHASKKSHFFKTPSGLQ